MNAPPSPLTPSPNATVKRNFLTVVSVVSLIYQKDRALGSALAALKVLMNELGLCEKEMWPPLVAIEGEEEAELRVRIAKALGI